MKKSKLIATVTLTVAAVGIATGVGYQVWDYSKGKLSSEIQKDEEVKTDDSNDDSNDDSIEEKEQNAAAHSVQLPSKEELKKADNEVDSSTLFESSEKGKKSNSTNSEHSNSEGNSSTEYSGSEGSTENGDSGNQNTGNQNTGNQGTDNQGTDNQGTDDEQNDGDNDTLPPEDKPSQKPSNPEEENNWTGYY